ncbi:MAG: helix-turn-helix domain-containing protein [Deltaproteobacteria bacterium]|nr:helix-turn-helix domain-containing protein [Deltaproteobacteria bacterium]
MSTPTHGADSGPGSYLLNRTEAARFLGVSRKTVLRFASQRRIPVSRICKKLLFRKADLEKFADSRIVPARRARTI